MHKRATPVFYFSLIGICFFALAVSVVPAWGQQGDPDVHTVPAAKERITALRAAIAHHDELYFKQAAPEISDFAYDRLKEELAALEREFPAAAAAVAPLPPSGDDRTGAFSTRRHLEPMLSLAKTYSEADLRAFDERIARQLGREDLSYVVEPKIDGIAVSVTYENGRLARAVTRGNGTEGDDITENARTIESLPRKLRASAPDGAPNPIPELIELRGEIYFTHAEFARINREREAAGMPPFAHPRNLAAGTAKLRDAQELAARRLDVVFFGTGACEPATIVPATLIEFRELLQQWGLPVPKPMWPARGAERLWEAVQTFDRTRHQLRLPTDGAVVKLDSIALQHALGATEEAPRWALAFKFAPDRAATKLLAISVQVGRTGVLSPVAEFEPVELGGSTVARASLHNRHAIARLDLRIGDHIVVERAGQVIPQVVGVDLSRRAADARPYHFPETCPSCGSAAIQSSETVPVYCPNSACPAQLRRRLKHFVSSACAGIDGLGPAMIATLVEKGWVHDIADLYQLRRSDLLSLGDDVAISTDQLLAAVERSKQLEFGRLIHGLGIPGVGAVTSQRLAVVFADLETLANAPANDLRAVESVGAATAAHIVSFFATPQNRNLVSRLREAGVRPVAPRYAAGSPGPLDGKTLVLTGALPNLTRAEATRLIEAAGAIVQSDVSRDTDFLVVGENPGGKLDRARALDVNLLDESGLRDLLDAE